MELTDRTAFVTGGSGDIGAAICMQLARAGCDVIVGYTGNREGAESTTAAVHSAGRRAAMVQLDQSDPAQCDEAAARAAAAFGRLDILVNNAAWNIGIPFAQLDDLTIDIWDRIYDTNVRGPFALSRAAAKEMRKTGAGRIVNIASVAGVSPGGSSIAYATSKAALIHLTRCLAVALAPEITVNCVAPGLVENTRMALRLPPAVAEGARQRAILKRASSAEDIAAQTVMFCQADSITGQTLVVDGGIFFH